MPRIVDPNYIPSSLWDPLHPATSKCQQGCVHLPPQFAKAYQEVLEESELLDRAKEHEEDTEGGATGSADDGGASEHFARRFAGSAARVQLYAIDPRNDFSTTSDALFTLFAGGGIRLLDIPIGTGAASAILLSVVSEMRAQNVLPRHATNVSVIGGDVDRDALQFASRLYEKLGPTWTKQGIEGALKCREWDVTSDESTGDLVDEWADRRKEHDRCAVVIANFSGFLCEMIGSPQKRRIETVDFSIRHVLLRAAKLNAPIFWIEPSNNPVGKMFTWLEQNIAPKFKRLTPAFPGSKRAMATTRSPVVATVHFTARIQGIHWKQGTQ